MPRNRPCLGYAQGGRCRELTRDPSGRCDRCRSIHESARNRRQDLERGSSTERGYGREHRKLRDEWKPRVEAGEVHCARPGCGKLIEPGSAWDLGHNPDRSYRGPEHRTCNRATRGERRKPVDRAPRLPSPLDTI